MSDDDQKNPVELALDLLVYAPLGFALEARTVVPKLVERGRQQVTMARVIGQFAVQRGQSKANKRLSTAGASARSALIDLGLLPDEGVIPTNGASAARPAAAPVAAAPAAPEAATAMTAAAEPAPAGTTATAEVPVRDEALTKVEAEVELAIPDYDSLAASQVIPRLAGLTGAELEAVRVHEAGHRGRKTILNRVAQLQVG
jgi:hypothetical protein